jgi:sugar phosphate isomerase/epimerase
MKKPTLGAQLYTVRSCTQNAAGIAETLRKVAEIGYTEVQISGFGPVDAKEVAALASEAGLSVVSSHTSWQRFRSDLDGVIRDHRLWGCRHPAIGGLPGEYLGPDGLTRFADELVPIARRLAEEGMDFSYHNHNHELARYDGKPWLERLYELAGPDVLKVEIDTYWIQAGGGDPAAWVRRYPGRQPLLHLKDMVVTPQREQRFAEVGEGNLNWPAILEAAEQSGVRHLLVEQDDCYGRDPFESLAISYRNLRRMGYE